MHITQKSKIDQAETVARAKREFENAAKKLQSLLASLGVDLGDGKPDGLAFLGILNEQAEKTLQSLVEQAGHEALKSRMEAPMEMQA